MTETIKAWHFVGSTLRDGRPVPADGVWLEHDGPVLLCESGLHASLDPWDALVYAPGPVLCRVRLAGGVVHGEDKLVAHRRQIIHRVDLTEALRAFARDEARRVLHLWDAQDVVREYLETGREDLRSAAASAAWTAADSAAPAAWAAADSADSAAWAAHSAAARSAAWSAADSAARSAAWSAADSAAWAAADSADSAAWAAVYGVARSAADFAADSAARSAAWSAARSASADRFRTLVAQHVPAEVL